MKCLLLLLLPVFSAAAWQGTTNPTPQATVPPSQQPQQAKPEKKPGTIEGSVVMAAGGAPVRKAQVSIYSESQRMPIQAATNEAGKFVFEKVPPGEYNFNVLHHRFTSVDSGGGFSGESRRISVAEGQSLKGIIFKMAPGAVVTGRVLDEFGDPQPRANVSLQRYSFYRGKKQFVPTSVDTTDDRGEFRIFNVPPGRYFLSVQYEDGRWGRAARGSQANDSSYPPVYYPGVIEPEMGMALDLHTGEERQGMDLRLVRDRSVRLKGRVMEGGKPVREAGVMLMQKGAIGFRSTKHQSTETNGEFEFSGIRPGSYILMASQAEDPQERLQGRIEVQVGSSNLEGLVIELMPGLTIPGQVVVEGDSAASVSFEEKSTQAYLESEEQHFLGSSMGKVKAGGSFELQYVLSGTYRARLQPLPDGGYLSGATFGDQDVTGKEFEILPGMQGPLKLRVRMAAATITGTVKTAKGQPAPNTKVLIAPEMSKRDQTDLFRLQVTDQYGSFSAKNLPPGEYRAWALSKIDWGQHLDPDFLAQIEKQGEKVEADEKGSYTLDLKVIDLPETQ